MTTITRPHPTITAPKQPKATVQTIEHPLVAVWRTDPKTGQQYCQWVRDR